MRIGTGVGTLCGCQTAEGHRGRSAQTAAGLVTLGSRRFGRVQGIRDRHRVVGPAIVTRCDNTQHFEASTDNTAHLSPRSPGRSPVRNRPRHRPAAPRQVQALGQGPYRQALHRQDPFRLGVGREEDQGGRRCRQAGCVIDLFATREWGDRVVMHDLIWDRPAGYVCSQNGDLARSMRSGSGVGY